MSVDIAGPKCRDLGLRIRHEAEDGPCQSGLYAPIAVIAGQFEPVAAVPAGEAVGAGADGVGLVLRGGLLRHDDHVAPGEAEEEIGCRLLQPDDDGRGIGGFDRRDRPEELTLGVGRFGRDRAFERELHLLGREGRAVMEGGVAAQFKAIGDLIRRDLPAFGEAGLDLSGSVDLHQPFEDVLQRDFADRLGRSGGGIERRRLQRHRNGDAVLALRLCDPGEWQGQSCRTARQYIASRRSHAGLLPLQPGDWPGEAAGASAERQPALPIAAARPAASASRP